MTRLLDADPSLANAVGDNPYWSGRLQALHLAVIWRQAPMAKLLLERGADPKGRNDGYGGWSPLMLATARGDAAIASLLLEAGAAVGVFEAAALGDVDRVSARLRSDPASACEACADGTTPLHLAASPGMAQLLLDAGADPSAVDNYGTTPLHSALGRTSRAPEAREVVDLLIQAGAQADAAVYAALGDVESLSSVFEADRTALNRLTSWGGSPLHAAVSHGRLESVRWLIGRGAGISLRDGAGATPLHLASMAPNNGIGIAQLLVEAHADPQARDETHGATPLSWAEFQRKPELAAFLRRCSSAG